MPRTQTDGSAARNENYDGCSAPYDQSLARFRERLRCALPESWPKRIFNPLATTAG
jgi:hypothetical protein